MWRKPAECTQRDAQLFDPRFDAALRVTQLPHHRRGLAGLVEEHDVDGVVGHHARGVRQNPIEHFVELERAIQRAGGVAQGLSQIRLFALGLKEPRIVQRQSCLAGKRLQPLGVDGREEIGRGGVKPDETGDFAFDHDGYAQIGLSPIHFWQHDPAGPLVHVGDDQRLAGIGHAP